MLFTSSISPTIVPSTFTSDSPEIFPSTFTPGTIIDVAMSNLLSILIYINLTYLNIDTYTKNSNQK